jgi:hypothetical protein
MPLTFRNLAIVATVVCFALSITWLLAPNLLLAMWGVEYSYPVGLLGRRGAALFLGIGVMFLQARNAEPSPIRSALASGFIVGCVALAALGVFELVTGHAGPGILSAVAVEVALALAFFASTRTDGARLDARA